MNRKQKRVLIRIIISAVLLVCLAIIKLDNPYIRFCAYLVPYIIIGYDILKKAFKGILRRQVFDENFLMAVATVGAFAVAIKDGSGYTEAVAVMLFYQIGELFQSLAVGKSRRSISALMDIRPDTANLETGDGVLEVSPEEVEVGSVIVVSPGEKIPIDGTVIEGSASLDTAALTGESLPREVSVGDEVISGCVCLDSVLRIRTTKEFGESTVSKILDLVENSGMKKAKTEKFISKFARVYTPAVCISALMLALLPPLVLLIAGREPSFSDWIYRALTFLVISCPCALVISVPLTFFAGIGGASRDGILIKGASFLETLSKTKTVVFDKTGTLTKGSFEVTEINCEEGITKAESLELCAFAESYSNHPISISLRKAYGKDIPENAACEVREISGKGVIALVNEKRVAVGNEKLMKEIGADYKKVEKAGTVVYASADGKYLGSIVISDVIKPEAVDAIAALKKAGVSKTVMLTGDSASAANAVALKLAIDEVHSELLPEDKVRIVEELLGNNAKNEKLAFAGDGINDAPVLSRADVGIAMGALGSDAAIEAADIVLMDDNPLKIASAISRAKKCLRIVYENIYFALGVKLICLLLGAFGIAGMWLAVFADVGVMVIAVVNAIRALK